jgi:hypothetical protein
LHIQFNRDNLFLIRQGYTISAVYEIKEKWVLRGSHPSSPTTERKYPHFIKYTCS